MTDDMTLRMKVLDAAMTELQEMGIPVWELYRYARAKGMKDDADEWNRDSVDERNPEDRMTPWDCWKDSLDSELDDAYDFIVNGYEDMRPFMEALYGPQPE